jgi:YVTN family beta-propeller protein
MTIPVQLVFISLFLAQGTLYVTPAGQRPVQHRGNLAVLPGGRVLSPRGAQLTTGPGTFGLAVSPAGKILTANLGPERLSLTVMEKNKRDPWLIHNLVAAREREPGVRGKDDRDADWKSVSMGVAFSGEKNAWVAEGNSGRVRLLDLATGNRRHTIDVNSDGFPNSFTGDLVADDARGLIYVTDHVNSRAVAIDTKKLRMVGWAKTGRLPFALALSEDRTALYVTNLGDNTLSVIDVQNPEELKLETVIRTGNGPSGVTTGRGRIFVSNAQDDSITIIDAKTLKFVENLNLRIPGLETLRGLIPLGMAYDAKANRLLVACAGINALSLLDFQAKRLSFVPVGLFPTRIVYRDGTAYVSNAKGQGTGPNVFMRNLGMNLDGLFDTFRRGSVSVFTLPVGDELRRDTQTVFGANGFVPIQSAAKELPKEIRHVVLIVKEDRSFDEIFGDVAGEPRLARFGSAGLANGGHERLSVKDVNITPNQHSIGERWMFSDNFYADSETSADGHRWLAGRYPDAWTESSSMAANATQVKSEDTGTIWEHLERQKISYRRFDLEQIQDSDQHRASQFIQELQEMYEKPGKPLPQFIYVRLPNDRTMEPRPQDGYPFGASYVADNDYALGRILDYLSHSPWWKEMAVFATEASAQGGKDHIDSHRTVLMGASPWIKRKYLDHTNTSFPGLLKTVFRLLGAPPMNIYDATAADLSDVFTQEPDFTPYKLVEEDPRVFQPALAR